MREVFHKSLKHMRFLHYMTLTSSHLGSWKPGKQRHSPVLGSHLGLFLRLQSQIFVQFTPYLPLRHSFSQYLLKKPGAQSHFPSKRLHFAPFRQRHLREQFTPKLPSAQVVSQLWPLNPAVHAHVPFTWSHTAPFRQVQVPLQSRP